MVSRSKKSKQQTHTHTQKMSKPVYKMSRAELVAELESFPMEVIGGVLDLRDSVKLGREICVNHPVRDDDAFNDFKMNFNFDESESDEEDECVTISVKRVNEPNDDAYSIRLEEEYLKYKDGKQSVDLDVFDVIKKQFNDIIVDMYQPIDCIGFKTGYTDRIFNKDLTIVEDTVYFESTEPMKVFDYYVQLAEMNYCVFHGIQSFQIIKRDGRITLVCIEDCEV